MRWFIGFKEGDYMGVFPDGGDVTGLDGVVE